MQAKFKIGDTLVHKGELRNVLPYNKPPRLFVIHLCFHCETPASEHVEYTCRVLDLRSDYKVVAFLECELEEYPTPERLKDLAGSA